MDIDLNDLDLSELKSLEKKVGNAIESFDQKKRGEALAAVKAIAGEYGYKLEDLIANGSTIKTKTKAAPKYAHPEDEKLTYSGRGRRPAWLIQLLNAGHQLDDFLIK